MSATPAGVQRLRGDAATGSWHQALNSRNFKVARWNIALRMLPSESSSATVLVSELEALNVLAWRESLRRRPMILWGHGKGYVNDTGTLSDFVEARLSARAAHVMTYAPSGRDHLIEKAGLNPSQVTAIGNSTDSTALRKETLRLLNSGVEPTGSAQLSALYVGGLDAAKRIDFLLAAYEEALTIEPNFRLTVVGRGEDARKVISLADSRPSLKYVEEARGAELAKLGADAAVMWVPGRVGLVAIDALAMGLPVHTTNFAFHAPEIEFLREGEVEYFGPSPAQFAQASLSAIRSRPSKVFRNDIPSIQSVARRFADVVIAAAKAA